MGSSDGSKIINNSNVDSIVLTISVGNIYVRDRFWSDGLPIESGVRQTQSLLIIPVNCACGCGSRTSAISTSVDTRVVDKEYSVRSVEGLVCVSFCIRDLGLGSCCRNS